MQKFKPVAQNTEILNVSAQYETFGKYVLLEKLATGGMAEVFLARGSGAGGIGKFFAIKRILPQYADSPEFIDMFKDEAKIAINLSHSNIVSIHEFGVEKGQFFLVMDYVEGRNLRQILNKMKKTSLQFSFDQIVYVIKEVAAGLDHAHRCLDGSTGKPLNITHRDMSPQNVMVSFEGEVKIVDFGIAKAESQIETTRAGTLKGKFGYMSPEQAEGQPVDLRTDIFSLGIVLWELLANDRLFVANNEINTLRKIRDCQIPSLRKINPNIQSELERIVQKALARDRNLRYQTGAALHRDLSRFLNRQYPDFSPHDFSVFIKSVFADEILSLRKRLVEYTKINIAAQATRTAMLNRNENSQTGDSISLSNSAHLQTGSQSVASTASSLSAMTAPTAPSQQSLATNNSASLDLMDKTEISGSAISVPDLTSPSREMTVTQEPTENLHLKSSPTAVTVIPENVRERTMVRLGAALGVQQQPPPTPDAQEQGAVSPATPNVKKPLAPTLLLDEAALAKEAQKNYENVAREGMKSSPSITGIGGNLETEEVTSPSIVNRRPRNTSKHAPVKARRRKSRQGNPATFATFLVFALVCVSAYVYLVKYFTATMEPVIAKTDPVLGPIHDLLGVPRRTTTSSPGNPMSNPLPGANPNAKPMPNLDSTAANPTPLPEPGTAAFANGPTPLPNPEPVAAEASVAVTSNPSGAEIFINNQPTGLSTPNQVKVPGQGTFSITVRKRAYYDFKRTEITADAIGRRLDVNLQKMNVGFIDVEIFPPQDAILYVNGKVVPLYKSLARDIPIPGNTPVKVRAESPKQNSFVETTVTIGSDHRKVIQLNLHKGQRQPSNSK